MFRIFVLGLLTLFPCVLAPRPVRAETAIFYSTPDDVWGWCTNSRPNQVTACALKQCVGSGGKACVPVAFCSGGWNAIAQAEDPAYGAGIVCGVSDSFEARTQAVSNCVVKTNALCWTKSTFDGDGNQATAEDNSQFDLIWYVQDLLQMRGYKLEGSSGIAGSDTQLAISQFQSDQKLPLTGVADFDLLDRLIYATRGMEILVKGIKASAVYPAAAGSAGHLFVAAAKPFPVTTFGQDLIAMAEDRRLLALATVLQAQGTDCTTPAQSAEQMFDDGNSWHITCAEGGYTLIMIDEGATFVQSDAK